MTLSAQRQSPHSAAVFILSGAGNTGFWADGFALSRVKAGVQYLTFRDKMVSLAYEPTKPLPQSKAAHYQSEFRPFDAGVLGGVCGIAAAVADAGVCARARAAVRIGPFDSAQGRLSRREALAAPAVHRAALARHKIFTFPGLKSEMLRLRSEEALGHPERALLDLSFFRCSFRLQRCHGTYKRL